MTKQEREQKELERLQGMVLYERDLKGAHSFVFGIDEAGRGPLCGPVVTACVVLPENETILWLNDSKKLSEKKREELFPEIMEKALAYGIGMSSPERIDQINILNATLEAMKDAYHLCAAMLEERIGAEAHGSHLILVDGNKRIPGISEEQKTVVSGDAKCPSISAASILAKVTRDHLLEEYDKEWPEFGFSRHKGYGTKEHIEALKKYGPLPIHRTSFIGKFVNDQ